MALLLLLLLLLASIDHPLPGKRDRLAQHVEMASVRKQGRPSRAAIGASGMEVPIWLARIRTSAASKLALAADHHNRMLRLVRATTVLIGVTAIAKMGLCLAFGLSVGRFLGFRDALQTLALVRRWRIC